MNNHLDTFKNMNKRNHGNIENDDRMNNECEDDDKMDGLVWKYMKSTHEEELKEINPCNTHKVR